MRLQQATAPAAATNCPLSSAQLPTETSPPQTHRTTPTNFFATLNPFVFPAVNSIGQASTTHYQNCPSSLTLHFRTSPSWPTPGLH